MHSYGQIYSVAFSSADSSAVAKDIFEITGSTKSSFKLHEVHLGQIAAALTSSAIETLTVSIYRGATVAAAGGATATPRHIDARTSATATFAVLLNSSSPGSSSTSAHLLFSRPWNTQEPFVYRPAPEDRPVCKLTQRLQVRLGAPAAAIVIGGTIIIEEVGRVPGSTVR